MNAAVEGEVKWFNHSKGYGFIIADTGEEVFVHHNDIEMSGYRYLRRGQHVRFERVDRADGPRAVAVTVTEEAPPKAEPKPANEESTQPCGRCYTLNQRIQIEEDREHEFKSLAKARDPVRTISDYYIEKYINAFLNTNGGVIFFGIEDDGIVQGIQLDRAGRDHLRTEISKLINRFQPSVEPNLYRIDFVPVTGADATYVVEIHVTKGAANLYMTGSQNFFIRRDGSNFLMPFDMIRSRLQAAPSPAAESEALELGILLAMVFMSWSDEALSESERQLLEARARDEGLDEREVSMLLDATSRRPLLDSIVSYLPTRESRQAAATIAYLTALTDSVLTENELDAFDKMCRALGLSEEEREDIRRLGEQRIC